MKERNFKRSLNEKEKVMYAPFCGVGGIVYDQDAVYIDLGGSHSHRKSKGENGEVTEASSTPFVNELRELTATLDEKIGSAGLKIFSESAEMRPSDFTTDGKEIEEEDDDEEGTTEDLDEETSPIKTHNFSVVQEQDGRMRRKVIFDNEKRALDDVTEEMQAELENLKASLKTSENNSQKVQDDEEVSEDEEDSDENDEDSDDEETVRKSNISQRKIPSSSPLKTNLPEQSIKSGTLSKDTKSSGKTKNTEIQYDQSSSDSESSEDEDQINTSKDDDDVKDEILSEEDAQEKTDDFGVTQDEKEEESDEEMEENQNEESGLGSDDDEYSGLAASISTKDQNSSKEARISKAESAFYSRFRSRSLQKMIYDSADDYLNVSSRTDFDNANVAIREDTGMMESEQIKDLFIGGDYADTAKDILDADDEVDEDDFDDFEMLDEEPKSKEKKPKNEADRVELKKKLKEKFDMEYDDGKDGQTFYQEWKSAMEEQSKVFYYMFSFFIS